MIIDPLVRDARRPMKGAVQPRNAASGREVAPTIGSRTARRGFTDG